MIDAMRILNRAVLLAQREIDKLERLQDMNWPLSELDYRNLERCTKIVMAPMQLGKVAGGEATFDHLTNEELHKLCRDILGAK